MQFINVISLAACLALAHALPTKRGASADITFYGAAGAQYTLDVPLDGSSVPTNNVLSISNIAAGINLAAQCTLKTVDYPPALVEWSPGTWAVGPPQTVISISCTEGSPPPSTQYVNIEFDGAADAKYTLSVPLDGTVVPTNNVLSISTIVTTFAGLPYCKLQTVDYTPALVEGPPGTWAVGPPQTVNSIQCWPTVQKA